jgi:hypothetical protein
MESSVTSGVRSLQRTSKQVAKEAIINQIKKLVPDVLYEIKSFAFYDSKKVHNIKMTKIVDCFKNAMVSRAKPDTFYEDPDNEEHWCICLSSDECDEVQFQAINCKICGNFIVSDTQLSMIDETILELQNLLQYTNIYSNTLRKNIRNVAPKRIRCKCK